MAERAAFHPDWVSPPGATISDILRQRRMSQNELAQKLGATEKELQELIAGRAAITQDLATKLQSALGGSAMFWAKREKRYRDGVLEITRQLEKENGAVWLNKLPIADMVRFGWLSAKNTRSEKAAACLQFFGVPSVSAWSMEYRAVMESAVLRTSETFESQPGAVAAWLRQGELESSSIQCDPWNPVRLQRTLPLIRGLTRERDPDVFLPDLRRHLGECGVAVVVLRAPSGCRASGATKFLTDDKALMLLSFRYLSDDQFWFSVFHEAGHLLLHSHRLFLDAPTMPSSKQEKEANEFAANALVPPEHQSEMMQLLVDGRAVMRFARKVGVAPGIVVGQLQHRRRLERQQLNNLKRRYLWREK